MKAISAAARVTSPTIRERQARPVEKAVSSHNMVLDNRTSLNRAVPGVRVASNGVAQGISPTIPERRAKRGERAASIPAAGVKRILGGRAHTALRRDPVNALFP